MILLMTASERHLSRAARMFLVCAADDYTELFVLHDVLTRAVGTLSAEDERTRALEVLRELLEGDLVRVGDMRADVKGLAFWDEPSPNVLARVATIWSAEQLPRTGEGPWFYATPRGKSLVQQSP